MGSSQSVGAAGEEEESEEGEEEEEVPAGESIAHSDSSLAKKILEQEPEVLPCHASASPLSPQLSSLGTPRLGPSIKVWDPYNVLSPPQPPLSAFEFDRPAGLLVFLIALAESDASLSPNLLGSFPDSALTATGMRQTRALAVLLNSQAVRFDRVYCSPFDRARSMASAVCQGMTFPEDQIQFSHHLKDMSFGQWEGSSRSEIYTQDVLSLMETLQPDFAPPSGESLREVEFRMVQFLNSTILGLQEKMRADLVNQNQGEYSQETTLPPPPWDMLHKHRQGGGRKKSGKSRLQLVTMTDDEMGGLRGSSSCVGIFTHATPIKCLIAGLLGCGSAAARRFCVDDSSVTVLQHSWRSGWQIKRFNDTAHLRLM